MKFNRKFQENQQDVRRDFLWDEWDQWETIKSFKGTLTGSLTVALMGRESAKIKRVVLPPFSLYINKYKMKNWERTDLFG